jgi:uncharacterized membrane protein YfcA
MGYGNILTPLLILLGFNILVIIPAVLASQVLDALATTVAFNYHGNIHLTTSSEDTKIVLVLSLTGILGVGIALAAYLFIFTFNPLLLQAYVGIVVILVGLIALLGLRWTFTWTKLAGIATIGAINKGLTGGGYTPVITGGQLICGRDAKQAIGCSNLPKALISLIALLLYLLLGQMVFDPLFLFLTLTISIGAIISAPIASYLVKQANTHKYATLISIIIIILGVLTLVKTAFDIAF